MNRIFVINPGSTSTKIALYEDNELIFEQALRHTNQKLAEYEKITDQYEFRKEIVLQLLENHHVPVESLDAIVGRGGLVYPLEGGCYRINDRMLEDLKQAVMGEHASNLGALIAKAIGDEIGKPSFIVDPVVVDELEPLARYSGIPEITRISIFHALNQKAVARRVAADLKKEYAECNFIIAHLGGGISVGAHKRGKVVDVNNALNGDGPFTPERSGGLPVGQLTELCFSGNYTESEIGKLLKGKGGLVGYIGTNSGAEVAERISNGDEQAREVFEAMAYQIAKEIGAMASVLHGDVDAIVLTGGLAHNSLFTGWIEHCVKFIAPVKVLPGEDEMFALYEGALLVLTGKEEAKDYQGKQQ